MTDMTDQTSAATPRIVCDMTHAPDSAAQRFAEYERLFSGALTGRERLGDGIRFRFRADPGLEDWVRDLAAREKACCAFFTFDITVHDDEVWWDASVVDDDLARQILDEYYRLPDSLVDGGAALFERFTGKGLQVMIRDNGGLRPATPAEHGWSPDE
jgi:hypothetical protein